YSSARRLRRMMLPGLSSATVVTLFGLVRFIHPATSGLRVDPFDFVSGGNERFSAASIPFANAAADTSGTGGVSRTITADCHPAARSCASRPVITLDVFGALFSKLRSATADPARRAAI